MQLSVFFDFCVFPSLVLPLPIPSLPGSRADEREGLQQWQRNTAFFAVLIVKRAHCIWDQEPHSTHSTIGFPSLTVTPQTQSTLSVATEGTGEDDDFADLVDEETADLADDVFPEVYD